MGFLKLDPEEQHPDYDEAQDVDYDSAADPDFDEGAQPDYDDEIADPDAEDGGSQECRHRPQK